MQSAPGPETVVDGRAYLYFCGTGYLGLQGHAELIDAACDATRKWGIGAATSRAGWGTTPPVQEVEQRAARFWETGDAYYFASGYLGNHILLSAVADAADVVFVDEHAHYSINDACRFFDLPVCRFRHRDPQSLEEKLSDHLRPGRTPLVLSDGVFAARGELAPVNDYIQALRRYENAMLGLDDAHAVGVLGDRGRGSYEHHGVDLRVVNHSLPGDDPSDAGPRLYAVGTLSKAFGGHGGIIYGASAFIATLREASDYFRGASSPTVPAAAASAAGLRLASCSPELITNLHRNARLLKQGLRGLGVSVEDSPAPFVGIALGDAQNMKRIQSALADDGILIAYQQKYSGIDESGALRIAVFATHSEEMIERLMTTLGNHI